MADYFATSAAIDDSVYRIKRFLHSLQENKDAILDYGITSAIFNDLREGLERIFKVVLIKTLELQETDKPMREVFIKQKYKTHDLEQLWGYVNEICLESEIKADKNIVLEDIQYLAKDTIFSQLLKFCSYMGNASEDGGRYAYIENMLSDNNVDQTQNEADELYDIVMKYHDPNYRQHERDEIQKTYQISNDRIKRGENPQHQPPQPYQEKMRRWFTGSIIERIEKLLRSLAIYLRWAVKDGHLYLGTSINDFNKLTLGKTSY